MDLKDIQYTLKCTWEVPENCQLKDIVTFGDANDPSERSSYENEIVHTINEEQFLKLDKPVNNESCIISVVLEDPCLKIMKLSIVCEARIIELYGNFGEYIKTEDCTLLDSSVQRCFYNVQPNIYPTKQVSIKLLGIKNSVWIYGVKFLLRQESSPPSSYFDYRNVEEILRSSKVPISEKAERAKAFLQNYTNVFSNNPPKIDHPMLIKMFEENYLSQFTSFAEMGNNMTKCLSNLMRLKADKNYDKNSNFNELKLYVDRSIRQLEERVHQTISQQIKDFETKQNEKLDHIINLLQKS